jgi:hypothetical protein
LADLNPSALAISARVGGEPLRSIVLWINDKICCCLSVSLGASFMMGLLHNDGNQMDQQVLGLFEYPVTVFLTSF